ncbi:MAG: PHP domain-containing protein [Coriobacteriia bacterium]|nr:PHP domain-containing protein [Coriobacteriia bacterium]
MPGFVHLHVHSHFSFMDGAASLDGLVGRAGHLGMPAIALTDHQGLSGAIRFYRTALKAGIKPILGAEIVVEAAGIEGAESDLPPAERLARPRPAGFGRASAAGFHLTLLCRDMTGYRNLCTLLSRAHLRADGAEDDLGGARSVVTLHDLSRLSEGLIALSGCGNGEVGASVLAGVPWRARAAATRLARCFAPGDFHIELMHAMTPEAPEYLRTLADLAAALKLPDARCSRPIPSAAATPCATRSATGCCST